MGLSHIERLLRHLEVSPDAVLRQLIVLESSFAMSRVTFDLHEPRDWNPILQIPFCYRGYTSGALLSAQYDGRYQAAHQVVELSHEMLHILLWESFFVGDLCPTQNQFVAMSRLFEGYAYWFADIVLTERLRASSRKHEMLFSRHSLTSINFHPRVAFRELGIADHSEIKKVYLDTFTGQARRPRGLRAHRDLGPLFNALAGFYARSAVHLAGLYGSLDASGVFSQFWPRFCAIPGLPRLVDQRYGSAEAAEREFRDRPMLAGFVTTPATMRAVRLRRAVQTRAYSYLQLRWCIASGGLLQPRGTRIRGFVLEARRITSKLDALLDDLEDLVRKLATGASLRGLSRALQALDARYVREVRRWFVARDCLVGRRTILLTDSGYRDWTIDLDRLDDQSMRAAQDAYNSMISRLKFDVVQGDRRFLNNHLVISDSGSSTRERRRCLRENLCSPAMTALWTVRPSLVDPRVERFPEINHFFT